MRRWSTPWWVRTQHRLRPSLPPSTAGRSLPTPSCRPTVPSSCHHVVLWSCGPVVRLSCGRTVPSSCGRAEILRVVEVSRSAPWAPERRDARTAPIAVRGLVAADVRSPEAVNATVAKTSPAELAEVSAQSKVRTPDSRGLPRKINGYCGVATTGLPRASRSATHVTEQPTTLPTRNVCGELGSVGSSIVEVGYRYVGSDRS